MVTYPPGFQSVTFCFKAMLVELAPGGSGWPKTARPGNQEHALECRMCSATRCERNFGEKMVEGL